MKKIMFFYLESVQTWINLMHIEQVFQSGGWKIVMQSGKQLQITDGEYWKLTDELRGKNEDKQEE